MRWLFANDRSLIVASVAWLAVLGLTPLLPATQAAFAVSVLLITVNAFASLWTLTTKRQLLIGLNGVQIVLFGTLASQLLTAFGDHHYRFGSQPGFFDWVQFTAVHVLRAADLLDTLDEYGLHLQNLSHHSTAAAMILVSMHLTVDVFLIGLVLRWAKRFWPDPPTETRLAQGRRHFGWLLITLALYVGFAGCQQLSPVDWLLWPIDNLLRLLDVGDLFQLFGWRLHNVEVNAWTSSVAILFRLAAGFWMARLVIYLRATMFRTWGLSIDELTRLLDDDDANVRRAAATGLARSGPLAAAALPALIAALHDIDATVRCEAASALGCLGPVARAAVPRLVDAVWLGRRPLRLAAIAALARIEPDSACVRSLAFLWTVTDDETRFALTHTLTKIAPNVLDRLRSHQAKLHEPVQVPAPKRKPWQLCVETAQRQHQQADSILALIMLLLHEDFFAAERDTLTLQNALAAKGQPIQLAQLFTPLLMLTTEGMLSRRKSTAGKWVYRASSCVPDLAR